MPGDPQGLKPDLVILNDTTGQATVVDVTVPFEGSNAFGDVREAKIQKYNYLKKILAAKGYHKVIVNAFVIGSLGSWDPNNEPLLRQLGVHQCYRTLFRKLCSWQAISGSFNIWRAKCKCSTPPILVFVVHLYLYSTSL